MQKIAAYLLERTEDLQSPEARTDEGRQICATIERWLRDKRAATRDGKGTYVAVDGSEATYRLANADDGDRSWRLFELTEVTNEGRRFVTTVSVTVGHRSVFVFLTMEVGSVSTSITRIDVDPKCPKVIRDLLAQPGAWFHGASKLRSLSQVDGFDAGEGLATSIQAGERTIPFVVVSRVEGQPALPGLDDKLARDLAGVANVFSLDEDASWALTDVLRKPLSCYGGAVRIYWPRLTAQDDPYRHQLWTAPRLRGIEGDPRLALDRIRSHVRTVILRASGASVVRPLEIDDIRGSVARAEYAALQAKAGLLEDMKAKASSLAEFKELADSYARDNDELRKELGVRDEEIQRLRDEVLRLESDKQALVYQLRQVNSDADDTVDVEPDNPESDDREALPGPGEVRYYKKVHSTRSHDVLVQVGGCNHNSWQNSDKADKARKGIARLIGENSEWKRLQHCGSCTGGGLWRVEW